jgi:hypothetical protein
MDIVENPIGDSIGRYRSGEAMVVGRRVNGVQVVWD